MSSHINTQRARNTNSLFRRLKPLLIKRLSLSWLDTKTPDMKDAGLSVRNDATESNLVPSGKSIHSLSLSDETISQHTLPSKPLTVSQEEGLLQTAPRQSRAELHLRREHVESRIQDCLVEVEAAKKHYVQSQRAFFQANDEHEDVERLIKRLEEEEAFTESSRAQSILG